MARHMRSPRRSSFPLFTAGVALVVGIGIAGVSSASPSSPPISAPTQITSPLEALRPSIPPTPPTAIAKPPATKQVIAPKEEAPAKKSFSAIGGPQELEIPSAKFKYRVDTLPPESISAANIINPPLDPSVVYWVPRGIDSRIDITGHSSGDGSKWPLNVISDASLVKLGDPVLLTSATGKHEYVVSEIASLARGEVTASKYQDPDREHQVIIATCDVLDLYQRTRILVATRVS